ncbi:MAG: S-methyl-5-thioribose-1-phosphate isomerase [Bacteroidales bacterium]|nr:S-methyl-5-thioribose-1-phosphate isomerase [Bacteroidales bacterium]
MKVNGEHYLTVWMEGQTVCLIDQNALPFNFSVYRSKTYMETCHAIRSMIVRGAGAIGAAAGYAMAQAFMEAPDDIDFIQKARLTIENTRPTAQNLFYAVQRVYEAGQTSTQNALTEAGEIARENIDDGRKIGEYGNELIPEKARLETHCNAGWLAFVDYGSALSPIYIAKEKGKDIFVYVDETRPRAQGARLTAWELKNEKIPHAIIPDNAGAHLMQQGKIDMIIVGADRIAANGDVANKIGTLEKAIAAKTFGIPFYVAAPVSTIDLDCPDGASITIEERSEEEVHYQTGLSDKGEIHKVMVSNPGSPAFNPAFDVTPASYVSAIITNRGIIKPEKEAIKSLMNMVT